MRVYWQGSALLAPVPAVMVSCGSVDCADIITVGWTGVVCTRPPRVYISVRPERHSYGIIKERGEFVINLTPSSLVEVCDYCGTVTGRCVDKVKKTGLTLIPSKEVSAPTIADSPLSLECKVYDILHTENGTHDMFLADVAAVSVEDGMLDESGKLHLDRANLLVYSHGEYFTTGRKLGKIGISVENGKKGRKAVVTDARKATVNDTKKQTENTHKNKNR